ncbi:MAG: TonB-dependent receptor [Bacteroidota bacterium]|nr:TonB-dependent receptor [Bacteroidota bacterium]
MDLKVLCDPSYSKRRELTKTLLALKLTAVILLAACLQVSAKGVAQITLTEKNVPLQKVFKKIQKQTGYDFLFSYELLQQAGYVTVNVHDVSLQQAMEECLKGKPLSYKIVDKTIIIKSSADAGILQVSESLAPPPLDIEGNVTDSSGSPLSGASITVKGNRRGTQTDERGHFEMKEIAHNAVLVVSYTGYETREVKVDNGNTIAVRLIPLSGKLSGVEIVGYGTQRKESITGSIVSMHSAEIENPTLVNAYQSMEGRLPGLVVKQTTGQPGAEGFTLNIRGPNSFASDNSPLVIVNGVVGNLADLDPAFIESITVLKDASSASIYGARASNGVILVTTKPGKNNGLHLEYNGSYINQSKINWPKRVWNSVQFMTMWDSAAVNAGSGNTQYPESVIDLYKTPSQQYPSFNWEDFMIKPINIFKHSLAISGNSGSTNYMAAMGVWDQDGIVQGFNYKKYTGMFNMESQVSKRFKFGITTNGIVDKDKASWNGGPDEITSIINQNPDYEPYLTDGSGRYAWGAQPWEHPQKSPIAAAQNGGQWTNRFGFNGTAYTQLRILDGLTWEVKGGMSYNESDLKVQVPAVIIYNYLTNQSAGFDNGQAQITLSEMNTKNSYYTIYSTLNYVKTFLNDYHLNALVGISQEKNDIVSLQGYRIGFASGALNVLSAGPALNQTTGGTETEYALQSAFGRLNLSYKYKYLFEASLRRDGSSRFPPGDKYAYFPSFSGGWLLSREPFIADNLLWLSELKIRASYGQLGNDNVKSNYPYQAVLSTGASYPFSGLQDGVTLNALNNNQLKWEATTIRNLGLDVNIKNSLLYATFDYFIKNTSGILRQQQIPGYAGITGPFVNEGEVQNKGFEFVLGHKSHIGAFSYDAEFNISAYKNKVLKFGSPEYDPVTLLREGNEMNGYYMYEANGIYQSQSDITKGPGTPWVESPGDVSIRDVDGDGKVTPNDRVAVKGAYPNYYFGFNLDASWKGFNIGLFFQGVQGQKIQVISSNNNGVLPFSGGTLLSWWANAWTPENHSTSIPKMDFYGGPLGASTRAISTFWLDDASYTRLKNITLGYTLPASLTRRFYIQRFKIFFSAENLFTFTKYKFGDPESAGGLSYPMLRSLAFGVNVQF